MGNFCKNPLKELGHQIFNSDSVNENKSIDNNTNDNNNFNGQFTHKLKTNLPNGNTRYENLNDNNINNNLNELNNNEDEEEKKTNNNNNNNDNNNNNNNNDNNNNNNNNDNNDNNDNNNEEEIEKIINDNSSIKNNNPYNKRVFELINEIRQHPSTYANIVEDSIKYIQKKKEIITDSSGEEKEIIKIIFKKKLKVALTKGEEAFKEAANILRNMNPIKPLIFNEEILVPLPETKEEMKNPKFLKHYGEITKQNTSLEVYFKDLVKDPDISVLLMIVDDNIKNAGKKRNCLLNPDYKYISINSKFIGKNFIAYFSFSK